MHPGYHIRLARSEDLASLAAVELAAASIFTSTEIHGAFLDEVTSFEEFAEAQAEGHLWVAVCDNRCVGFAQACLLDDGQPWLEELDVHPEHGRRGLGRALVERVIAWARDIGAHSLALTTFRDVAWNAPFYERAGFRVVADADCSTAVRDILADERTRGLPMDRRVVMRLALTDDTARE